MTEKQIPDPLWPMPEGWEKPTVRLHSKPARAFFVWLPDITGGGMHPEGFESLDAAANFARQNSCEASKSTEYTERREKLARFLCNLVYGDGAWANIEEAPSVIEEDVMLNYRLDADDIIKANPHLLSLTERERLAHLIPELEYRT